MKLLRLLVLLLVVALLAFHFITLKSNPHDAFMGDSLTEGWTLPRVNLGIYGQTTAQMLARFPEQVPGHGYGTVFILGGTNDVLLHIDPQITVANLGRMADLAESAHIEPVLAEIPPIYRGGGVYSPAVDTLNQRIIELADARHLKLVNYYGSLVGHPDFESDGVHMKGRGYWMMDIALMRTKNPF
jgi:lysophospholipase L1-like esterase